MRYLSFLLAVLPLGALSAGCKQPGDAPAQAPNTVQINESTTAQQAPKTAYGQAEFGMSFEQVAALPQFKEWFLDTEKPAISNFEETIGERTYRVTFFFYQDQLYRVDFTTADDEYLPKSRYETDIRGEITNLRKYFSDIYGAPTTDNGMPRSTGLNKGKVTFVNKWRAGERMVTLGVSESLEGGGYKTVAQYYDIPLYQAARAEQ